MTEKRYYVNCAGYLCDMDLSNTLSIFECADLLNEQEEQIKELEKDLNDALNRIGERSIDIQLLKEENGNLKKENELKGDFRNFINEDIVRIKKENEKLKNEIKMLKSTIARNEAYITRLTKKGKWTK